MINLIRNNKFLLGISLFIKDLYEIKITKLCKFFSNENVLELKALSDKGVCVIPGVLTEQECNGLFAELVRLKEDYGVTYENDRRLWGIEQISEKYNTLNSKNASIKKLKQIGEKYLRSELQLFGLMAAYLKHEPDLEYGSGGSWHRDSFSKQYKIIVYLTDVDQNNGPFQYIQRSHKRKNIRQILWNKKIRNLDKKWDRYTEQDVNYMLGRYKQLTKKECVGKKGTAIIVDTRGVHTGKKTVTNIRGAITFYLYAKRCKINENLIKLNQESNRQL